MFMREWYEGPSGDATEERTGTMEEAGRLPSRGEVR